MFKSVLIATLLATAYAGPLPRLDGKIVGGHDDYIENFPHQLSLQFYYSHICGATIVDSKWAITAAHCTDGSSEDDLSLVAGISNLREDGQRIFIRKIHQHRNFSISTLDYDISVLELAEEIDMDATRNPAGLPDDDSEPDPGSQVNVSGWGAIHENGGVNNQLQSVRIQVVDRRTCNEQYGSITDRMICAGAPNKDSCQGDSGGPLVNEFRQLVGIVSWGYGCAKPGYSGVYSHVGNLRGYIRNISGL